MAASKVERRVSGYPVGVGRRTPTVRARARRRSILWISSAAQTGSRAWRRSSAAWRLSVTAESPTSRSRSLASSMRASFSRASM